MLNLNHNVRSHSCDFWCSNSLSSKSYSSPSHIRLWVGCGDGVFNILPGITGLVFEPEGSRHPDRWWFEQCINLPSLPLSLHCITNEYSLSQADKKKKKHTKLLVLFFLLLTPIPFPIIPILLLHPLISISNQLSSLHVFSKWLKMLEECHSRVCPILWGPVCVYGISACAYVDSATLLICKAGISAPPPPRRNTSKGNQTTGPLCGPDLASYQNRERCLHSAIVYGGRGFVWYVTHACSSLFTFWGSTGQRTHLRQFILVHGCSKGFFEDTAIGCTSALHPNSLYKKSIVDIDTKEIAILMSQQYLKATIGKMYMGPIMFFLEFFFGVY